MMKKECELWLVCGPGAIYHYHGKYLFSNDDPRRNYRDNFCFNDFKKCDHFLLRQGVQEEVDKIDMH